MRRRFDKQFLEDLTKDENCLLHYVYYNKFKRVIRLESVFVDVVLSALEEEHKLTDLGKEIHETLVTKIKTEYA